MSSPARALAALLLSSGCLAYDEVPGGLSSGACSAPANVGNLVCVGWAQSGFVAQTSRIPIPLPAGARQDDIVFLEAWSDSNYAASLERDASALSYARAEDTIGNLRVTWGFIALGPDGSNPVAAFEGSGGANVLSLVYSPSMVAIGDKAELSFTDGNLTPASATAPSLNLVVGVFAPTTDDARPWADPGPFQLVTSGAGVVAWQAAADDSGTITSFAGLDDADVYPLDVIQAQLSSDAPN